MPLARPLVIGHRGSSAVAPENTLAAFNRAMRDGADGIEFDVRLARDGVPVVIHDATLRRTALMAGAISDFPSTVLQSIGVGAWFNRAHPAAASEEYARETVPTLKQLLAMMAGNRGLLYLEMKSDDEQRDALAAAVVRLLEAFSFVDRVIVESFNLGALDEVKRLNSHIRTAALFEPKLQRPVSLLRRLKLVTLAQDSGADEIALHKTLVSKQVVAKALDVDMPVIAWTVDDAKWIERARALGIKAIITNDPERMIRARDQVTS